MNPLQKNKSKRLLLFIIVLLSIVSCNNEKYQLRWKIAVNEPVYYKIVSTTKVENKINVKINNEAIDSVEVIAGMLDALSAMQDLEVFIILQNSEDKGIDIKWARHNSSPMKKTEDMSIADMMALMMQALYIQATIDSSGRLLNDSLQQQQKNLLYMYCQLPSKAISIGDSWKLDVELIDGLSMYPANETENYNKVTLVDVKDINGQLIAFIEYDIFQSIETKIKSPFTGKEEENYTSYSFQVKAEFDIEKGRWKKFKETTMKESTGFIKSKYKNQTELVRVKKLPQELSKRLNGEFDEMGAYIDLVSTLNKTNPESDEAIIDFAKETAVEEDVEKDIRQTNIASEKKEKVQPESIDDCPVTYAVQVLAAKESISIDNKRFKSIRNEVYEVVKPEEVYKYKYCVGKECSKKDILQLKEKLLNKGFQGAFTVKILPKKKSL